jgi:hypothetical protein
VVSVMVSPAVNLSPVSLNFGSHVSQSPNRPQSVTLTNTGSGALSIPSIAASGDFAQASNCGTTVAVGNNCTINAIPTPTRSGARSGALSLSDNASGSPQSVTPSGPEAAEPGVSLTPAGLVFLSQNVGATITAQSITLTNTGTATLTITSIVVTGTNASDFGQTNSCGSSVAAGATCTIGVTFTPSASGARTATLSVTDNANGSPQTVSLSGTGNHDVILSWTASATPGVMGYNVYRGTTSGGESSTPLNSTPVNRTSYMDGNVTPGATYYYVVKAVASNGVSQSGKSNEVAATVPTP